MADAPFLAMITPVGSGGGGGGEHPAHPIVIPPDAVAPGVPTHPIYLPVHPSHPIVIPPGSLAPGVPTHPIYLPPPHPAHPIVIPPDAVGPGVPDKPVVMPPIYYPPGPVDPGYNPPGVGYPGGPVVMPPIYYPPGSPPVIAGGPGWLPPYVDNSLPIVPPQQPIVDPGDPTKAHLVAYTPKADGSGYERTTFTVQWPPVRPPPTDAAPKRA